MTDYEYDLFKICCFNKALANENYLIIYFFIHSYFHYGNQILCSITEVEIILCSFNISGSCEQQKVWFETVCFLCVVSSQIWIMAYSDPAKYYRSDTDCDKFVAPKSITLNCHFSAYLWGTLYMKVPGIEIICISVVVNWSHSSSVSFVSQTWFVTILWTFLSHVYFAKSCGKQPIQNI